jgi:hypothetical protein
MFVKRSIPNITSSPGQQRGAIVRWEWRRTRQDRDPAIEIVAVPEIG